MKAKLEFDLNEFEDRIEHIMAIKGKDAYLALYDVAFSIFRPARKHGYEDNELNKLLEKSGEEGAELIGKLEDLFYKVLEEREIDLETLP